MAARASVVRLRMFFVRAHARFVSFPRVSRRMRDFVRMRPACLPACLCACMRPCVCVSVCMCTYVRARAPTPARDSTRQKVREILIMLMRVRFAHEKIGHIIRYDEYRIRHTLKYAHTHTHIYTHTRTRIDGKSEITKKKK